MATYITHPECLLHEMGVSHPEQPARITVIEKQLKAEGIWEELNIIEAPPAIDEQLLLAHTHEHVENLKALSPKTGRAFIDRDTSMNPHSLKAAYHAAGAAIHAVDLVFQEKEIKVFCNVRPPGHHAEADRAMGFCLFNNVAVAAHHAMQKYGARRILIVDFDVHHGNGTEDIFKNDVRVMLCSSFQHPLYPYSPLDLLGSNPNIIKTPLDMGANGDDVKKVFEMWWEKWEAFQPEFVLVSAGFDAHREDPIGSLQFTDQDYAWMTKEIVKLAEKHAQGRMISSLEGGYNLSALGRSVAKHISEFF